ncbi:hypothetical protein K4L06_08745 [Lysobacter sp. BMK333-48F3]|uniref:hypothetical protein n=1 Tax=Lysobacter sp. BMK333-48F3 TaxID=2867962 RepID=UPI001C8BA623|nr:hypothetical protein [Lysobacter sp. BMK333-48F3]MBX9401397.1 hypothetical protein [Lysobacter sp. BMK333-48F3]
MSTSFAQVRLQALQPDDADYAPLLALAQPRAEQAVGLPLQLQVDHLDRQGDWAFLLSRMRAPDGNRIDWKRTDYAEQAAAGAMSERYAALFRRDDGQWRLIAQAVAPGDVAWETWPQEHGAPASLFGY